MIKKGNTNAKTELRSYLSNKNKIVCAKIQYGDVYFDPEDEDPPLTVILKEGYTPEEEEIFWNSLDFTYDNGYGGQELFGQVWLEDGKWLTRGEYDGSEWWNFHEYPQIPTELKSIRRVLKKL